MKNKKIKIELNSVYGKDVKNSLETDLLFIELYASLLEVKLGKEFSDKALEEMKKIRKDIHKISDINDFCLGFTMGSFFICENEEFVKTYKIKCKKEDKKDEV